MKLLAIESSCDETAASIVEFDNCYNFNVLSNIVSSQIAIHKKYGGVVPEVASRAHIENIQEVVSQAIENIDLKEIDAVAVTYNPGLIGALLVGVNYAKGLALSLDKPLIAVNHIEGHIASNYASGELKPPFVCLVASGGHTNIFAVNDYDDFELLAKTRDDAAGEAFDKIARKLGLGYPGGIEISRLAEQGNENCFDFPKVKLQNSHDFSFSGVKTAVINLLHKLEQNGVEVNKADVAASFQKAVVDVLVERTIAIARLRGISKIAISGGVAANKKLRETFYELCSEANIEFYNPDIKYCGDNAAMIGIRGAVSYLKGEFADFSLDASALKKLS